MKALTIGTLATALVATAAAARGGLHYGGGRHTSSHGGHFSGAFGGSSHKGGHYTSRTGSHSYGTHR